MKRRVLFLLIFMGCLSFGNAYSQEIKGTVVDAQGEPLIGASVKVVDGKEKVGNLSLGTVTNVDGEYALQVPHTNFSLEFSYIGYETTTIPLSNTEALRRVVLKDNSAELAEVVITGMQRVDKRLFTGAAVHLNQGDVKIDGIAEVGRSLEGRVAGVSVQNVSGTFGTAPKIRVRGATSIYGDSSPLWVVDGVVIQNVVDVSADELSSGDAETVLSSAVAGLNASDIESWDILKDGTASSIYGARAKAGVIVITTKKGIKNTSSINYRGEYTARLVPSYADFNIMNSQDQMAVYQEMQTKGWLNFSNTYRRNNSGVYGKMYELMNTYDPVTGTFALQQTEEAINGYLREAERRNTNWFQELFNPTSIIQNHSVSMSGGTERSTYYGSVSALIDPGWFKQSDNKRYTANLQLNHKLSNTLNLDILSRTSYRSQSGPGTMGRTTNAVYGEVSRNFDINPYSYALNSSRTLDPNEVYKRNYADFNIKDELDANYMDYSLVDLTFQGKLTWNILKGWDVEVLGATAYSTAATEHHVTEFSNQAMAYREMSDSNIRNNNPYLYKDPDNVYALPISILPYGGIYERSDNKSLSYNFRATTNYVTAFKDVHVLGLFGGMEIMSSEKGKTWFRGWGRQYAMGDVPFFDYRMFKHDQEAGLDYYTSGISRERTAAFFAKGDYSYQGKYILSVTGRYDGSNRMGKSRKARWTPTWNVGLAWNLHEEDFFQALAPVLTHAKINPSYSLTADRPSVTNALAIIRAENAWRPDVSSQEPSLYISSLENSELTYEKKHEYNIGVELGFFDNRISLLADAFKRYNFDLIGRLDVMGVGGEVQKYANVATMSGKGFEATLSTKNIVKKDFRWTTSFIFSNVQVKVEELKNERRVIDLITGNGFGMVGYPDRALFSIPFAGLNEDGLPTFINENNEVSYLVNNQERTKLDFLKYEGPSNPTITGSFGNIFNYKNFRFNVYITYSAGNKLRLDPYFSYTYTDYSAMPKEFKNRWILPGDEAVTNIPVIPTRRQVNGINNLRYAYNSYNYSDVRVADGGFVRLKEISVSYDFPKRITSALRVRDLQAKLQGTNLMLLYADSKLNGQDPEFFNSGGVAAPMAKQITFTLSLGI